jgi:hypothetical protein
MNEFYFPGMNAMDLMIPGLTVGTPRQFYDPDWLRLRSSSFRGRK